MGLPAAEAGGPECRDHLRDAEVPALHPEREQLRPDARRDGQGHDLGAHRPLRPGVPAESAEAQFIRAHRDRRDREPAR